MTPRRPVKTNLTPFSLWLFSTMAVFPRGPVRLATNKGGNRWLQIIVEPDVRDVWPWGGWPHQWKVFLRIGQRLIHLRTIPARVTWDFRRVK